MFNHLPKRFGERQQLIEEIVSPPEADDINDPHALEAEANITPLVTLAWTNEGSLDQRVIRGFILTPLLVLSVDRTRS